MFQLFEKKCQTQRDVYVEFVSQIVCFDIYCNVEIITVGESLKWSKLFTSNMINLVNSTPRHFS